jgi:hypothetical protein
VFICVASSRNGLRPIERPADRAPAEPNVLAWRAFRRHVLTAGREEFRLL